MTYVSPVARFSIFTLFQQFSALLALLPANFSC